jgi:hypothetical protein
MTRTFQAFKNKETQETTIVEKGPNSASNQEAYGYTLWWEINVSTWEEAMAIYELRCGLPLNSPGSPVPCKKCGEITYPYKSGSCWNCG